MKWHLRIIYSIAAVVLVTFAWSSVLAASQASNPIVIYRGPIADGAYNAVIHNGVERYRTVTGEPCVEITTTVDTSVYEHAVHTAASQGYSPIIIPYGDTDSVRCTAQMFPRTRFVLLEGEYDQPNIYSFQFDEHEGSFLAGALAAMTTRSGKIGFVGGDTTGVTPRFLCGYKQGARYINPQIAVMDAFIGENPSAWHDSETAARLTREQIADGADIIFQVAGEAGLAVLHEAAHAGVLGIGVDSNQNDVAPGSVLTSMVKRVDKAVFAMLMVAHRGGWRENHKRLGLSQQIITLAFDKNNAQLVSVEHRNAIAALAEAIQLGRIHVYDYARTNSCPIW